MKSVLLLPLCLVVIPMAGCSTDAMSPTMADPFAPMTGTFHSTTFIIPGSSDLADTIDQRGGYITLTLAEDHSVQGRLLIPSGSNRPVDLDVVGTYTIDGDTVRFATNDDWPIDALPWVLRGNEMRSAPIRDEPTTIILRRQ